MPDTCTTAGLARAINKCKFVSQKCGEQFDTFNMLYVQYCYAGGYSWIGIILSFCLLLLLMRHIEHVSGDYLSVAIAALSKGLGLSELVAGSTLLALSNGATDLITAVVSATSSSGEGLDMVIGSLYGASIFSILCIFAVVIMVSPEGCSLKDCGLSVSIPIYIAADLVLLAGMFFGVPVIVIGTFFIGIYVLYIRKVLKEDRESQKQIEEENKAGQGVHSQGNDAEGDTNASTIMDTGTIEVEPSLNETQDDHEKHVAGAKNSKNTLMNKDEETSSPNETDLSINQENIGNSNLEGGLEVEGQNAFAELVTRLKFEYSQTVGFWSVLYVLETTLKLITAAIIPAVEEPFIKGIPLIVFVFTIPLFYMATNEMLDSTWTVPGTNAKIPVPLVVLLVSISVYKFCKPKYRRIALSIASSVVALDYLVGIVVDLLTYVKIKYGMDSFFLALTILGVANSVVDLFVDRSLALAGFTAMAVSGVFSGQLFNLLLGMSLTGLIQSVLGKSTSTSLLNNPDLPGKNAFMMATVIIFHIVALVGLLGYLKATQWQISKKAAYYLGLIYLALLIFMTIIEFVL